MSRSVRLLALLPVLLAKPIAAENVCVEFLSNWPTEEAWEKACIEWLGEHETEAPSPPFPQSAASQGQAASASSLSFSVGTPVHVSADDLGIADENQAEVFIAVDPVPQESGRAFVFANQSPRGNGIFGAYAETDMSGDVNWTPRRMGEQNQTELPAAWADPWAVFTEPGTLFVSYLLHGENLDPVAFPTITPGTRPTIVAMSTNGGETFEFKEALGGTFQAPQTDRGSLATGPGTGGAAGSLWVLQDDGGGGPIVVRGAELDGQGELVSCGPGPTFFCSEQVIADPMDVSGNYRPGHIAVGPSGEVLASFLRFAVTPDDPFEVFAVLDEDGAEAGSSFPDPGQICPAPPEPPTAQCIEPLIVTNVGFGEEIGPSRIVTPLANLAWHRASGRVYLVTTIEEPDATDETDVVLLWSDGKALKEPPPAGAWSDPIRVNDDPEPTLDQSGVPLPDEVRSQFFPHVAVDQTTGAIAVAWYDPRNDDGSGGTNDQRDATPNTEPEVFLRVGLPTPTGLDFAPSFAVSDGSSDDASDASFGDYLGVAFHDGRIWTSWADNSSSAGNNPADEGCSVGPDPMNPRPCMDAYVSVVEVMPEPSVAMQLPAAVGLLFLFARRRAERVVMERGLRARAAPRGAR